MARGCWLLVALIYLSKKPRGIRNEDTCCCYGNAKVISLFLERKPKWFLFSAVQPHVSLDTKFASFVTGLTCSKSGRNFVGFLCNTKCWGPILGLFVLNRVPYFVLVACKMVLPGDFLMDVYSSPECFARWCRSYVCRSTVVLGFASLFLQSHLWGCFVRHVVMCLAVVLDTWFQVWVMVSVVLKRAQSLMNIYDQGP